MSDEYAGRHRPREYVGAHRPQRYAGTHRPPPGRHVRAVALSLAGILTVGGVGAVGLLNVTADPQPGAALAVVMPATSTTASTVAMPPPSVAMSTTATTEPTPTTDATGTEIETETATATPTRRTSTAASRSATRTPTTTKATASATKSATDGPAPTAGGSIVAVAARYVGAPYVYGGTTPAGWDCSGYTSFVYRQVGISIPRTSQDQQAAAAKVSNPVPGDLIFFGYPAYHVGIFAGDGQLYEAANPKTGTVHRAIWTTKNVSYGRFA